MSSSSSSSYDDDGSGSNSDGDYAATDSDYNDYVDDTSRMVVLLGAKGEGKTLLRCNLTASTVNLEDRPSDNNIKVAIVGEPRLIVCDTPSVRHGKIKTRLRGIFGSHVAVLCVHSAGPQLFLAEQMLSPRAVNVGRIQAGCELHQQLLATQALGVREIVVVLTHMDALAGFDTYFPDSIGGNIFHGSPEARSSLLTRDTAPMSLARFQTGANIMCDYLERFFPELKLWYVFPSALNVQTGICFSLNSRIGAVTDERTAWWPGDFDDSRITFSRSYSKKNQLVDLLLSEQVGQLTRRGFEVPAGSPFAASRIVACDTLHRGGWYGYFSATGVVLAGRHNPRRPQGVLQLISRNKSWREDVECFPLRFPKNFAFSPGTPMRSELFKFSPVRRYIPHVTFLMNDSDVNLMQPCQSFIADLVIPPQTRMFQVSEGLLLMVGFQFVPVRIASVFSWNDDNGTACVEIVPQTNPKYSRSHQGQIGLCTKGFAPRFVVTRVDELPALGRILLLHFKDLKVAATGVVSCVNYVPDVLVNESSVTKSASKR